jgi:hypothetical protein
MGDLPIDVIEGPSVTLDDPWITSKTTQTTKSGTSPEQIARISIPDNQISTVNVVISVSGIDGDGRYGGYFREILKIDKADGIIRGIERLDAVDEVGFNFQADFGKKVELFFSAPVDANTQQRFRINGEVGAILPFTDKSSDQSTAQRSFAYVFVEAVSDIGIPNVKGSQRASAGAYPKVVNEKANVGFNFELPDAPDISKQGTLEPTRSISRKPDSGDLVYESENRVNYGIQEEKTGINARAGDISTYSGERYFLFANIDNGFKPYFSQSPDFVPEKISNTSVFNDGRKVPRYVLHLLTDSSGINHAIWADSNSIYHAENSSGSWQQEKIVDWGVPSQIGAEIDDNDIIHIIAAENVQPGNFSDGDLRYFYGTTGNWTDDGRVGNSTTGKFPRVAINGADELGIIITDSSGDLSFNSYDGNFSGWEAISSVDRKVHGICWQDGKWHISHQNRSASTTLYSYGTSGSWDIDNEPFPNQVGLDPYITPTKNNQLFYFNSATIADGSAFAHGIEDSFNSRYLRDGGGRARVVTGENGRVYLLLMEGIRSSAIIQLGEPREVEYNWKAVSEIYDTG